MRTEVVAGLATWLTMAYILFVNPAILGAVADTAGTTLPFGQVLTVTALVGRGHDDRDGDATRTTRSRSRPGSG